jgi:hypothetical protein
MFGSLALGSKKNRRPRKVPGVRSPQPKAPGPDPDF